MGHTWTGSRSVCNGSCPCFLWDATPVSHGWSAGHCVTTTERSINLSCPATKEPPHEPHSRTIVSNPPPFPIQHEVHCRLVQPRVTSCHVTARMPHNQSKAQGARVPCAYHPPGSNTRPLHKQYTASVALAQCHAHIAKCPDLQTSHIPTPQAHRPPIASCVISNASCCFGARIITS